MTETNTPIGLKSSITTVLNSLHYKSNRLQQIRGFCNVVVLGSITRAARAMGLTQPAVTAQVKSLERDLNKILFSRKGKSLSPTTEGLAFYDFVSPTLHKMDRIYEEYLVRSDYLKDNNLNIVGYHSAIAQCLPGTVSALIRDNDDINISITQDNSRASCIETIRQDIADIALCNQPSKVPDDLVLLRTIKSDARLIHHIDHPISKIKRPLTTQDIQAHQFLYVDYDQTHVNLVNKYKLMNARTKFINCTWESIWAFVERGTGVTLATSACQAYVVSSMMMTDVSHLFPPIEYQLIGGKHRQKTSLQKFLTTFEAVPKPFSIS